MAGVRAPHGRQRVLNGLALEHAAVEVAGRRGSLIGGLVQRLRVAGADTPYPPGRLEDAFLPSCTAVVAAALKIVGER